MANITKSLIIKAMIPFLALTAAGCTSSSQQPKPLPLTEISRPQPSTTQTAEQIPAAEEALPDDIKPYTRNLGYIREDLASVIQAVFYRLQGAPNDDMGPVHFDSGVGPLNDGDDVSFQEFVLRKVSIRRDEAGSDNIFHRRLEAVVEMADILGKKAFLTISADYLIGDNAILIRQAVAEPFYPDITDVKFLIVPSKRLPSLKTLRMLPLGEIYRIAGENAYTGEQLAAITEPVHCKLAVFNMVRSRRDDRLRIYTSGEKACDRANVKHRISINEKGWTAVIVDGVFEFNSAPSCSFVIGSSKSMGEEGVKIIGSFDSVVER